MTDLKALLFDVDGTLADTEADGHRVAFNRAFREAGLDWDWSVALYGELLAVTGGKERIDHYLVHYRPDFAVPGDRAHFIAELHRRKTARFTAMLADGAIPLRSGVERLLNEARGAGLKLAIATTTTPANVEALLTHTLGPQSLDWFAVIAAGDMVPAKKPAPDIYQYAMAELGLSAAQCVAFEDSAHGLSAARDAGLATIVAVNGYTREQDFADAALVLDRWGEPDAPFRVLAGDAGRSTCVDLALVRSVLERSQGLARTA